MLSKYIDDIRDKMERDFDLILSLISSEDIENLELYIEENPKLRESIACMMAIVRQIIYSNRIGIDEETNRTFAIIIGGVIAKTYKLGIERGEREAKLRRIYE